jgi:hypothetical protein
MTETQFVLDEDYEVINTLPMPLQNGITIYGKSNCPSCLQLKIDFDEICHNSKYINCDEYLLSNKESFKQTLFEYMQRKYTGKELLSFPIIFRDSKYVPTENFWYIKTYDA